MTHMLIGTDSYSDNHYWITGSSTNLHYYHNCRPTVT